LTSYLEEKVAAPVKKTEITTVQILCADHTTPLYPQKLTLTSPISGSLSVGIVRSRTKATVIIIIIIIIVVVDVRTVSYIPFTHPHQCSRGHNASLDR
jgi:hypothetical protein